ncbi:neuropeptide SIFamide receptor-like [Exaiptasia diaphana]|uniref:G-protein coupled receptors family 1 profile domain-containing protein n=1 Tax=Exaiptasia diaphana TaxID=2652724 RepID=A0A913WSI2_EXADI|nr:neuropeptide SIFamide receptor-like [Exaiptasia diaphana]
MNVSLNESSLYGRGEIRVSHKVVKTLAYSFLFVLSILGNSFIVWAISKDSRLRTNTNFLVTNIAISDILFALVNFPQSIVAIIFDRRWMLDGIGGLIPCKLIPFISDVSSAVSLYSCVFIAIDRYYAVAYPLRGGFSRSRMKYIVPGIWIASSVVISPYLYYFKLIHGISVVRCIWEPPYTYLMSVIGYSFGITAPVITIMYVMIVYKLWTHTIPGERTESFKRREKQNRNVFKLSVAIVMPLYMTELALVIAVFLKMFGNLASLSSGDVEDLMFAVVYLKHTSVAYNFFVYLRFNEVYRENFRKLMSRCFCSCFHFKAALPRTHYSFDMNSFDHPTPSVQTLNFLDLSH